jgi:polar amino acid transport system substrate-binding protein
MVMDFARTSLLGKARERPDLVKQVARKLQQEGPLQTYRAVTSRLESPQALGYSLAGVVESVGEGVNGFTPGDRVACAGAGYANHAELNAVPENLVARVPDGVALDRAAYATVGAIALQGLRLARPTLGEIGAVIGLGLIGQLAVQLLRANGVRVLGLDTDPSRVKQALDQGAEWAFTPGDLPDAWTEEHTGGLGVDLALLAASTDSNAPVALAGELCRLKGRVSIIGAVSMELDRRTFYGKELEVQVSMSYGPGRYDWRYEEAGFDYPLPYVRWTENRNLQAFLSLLASGGIDPSTLETETVAFADAERAYEELAKGERRTLSMVFRYEGSKSEEGTKGRTLSLPESGRPAREGDLGVAFLGAGNYAKGMLLPAVQRCKGVRAASLVTATGPSARRTAERFGYASCGTDPEAVLADPDVDMLFVATRHDTHAGYAIEALRRGKAVWLEKPVGLSSGEVDEVVSAARETGGFLTVGYNRRCSPHTRAIAKAFAQRSGPLFIDYLAAPGPPPSGTWHTDPQVGGGRVIGEVCHFVDLCTFLVGQAPSSVFARGGSDPDRDDCVVALLGFPDGSAASVHYLSRASVDLPKERFEVSGDGITASCDNFRSTRVLGAKPFKTLNQDKGQATAVAEAIAAVKAGSPSPIPLEQIAAVSRATFAILESLRTGAVVDIEA